MRGIKLLGLALAVGWVASFVLTISEYDGNLILLAVQALPAALIVGLVCWLFANKEQTAHLLAKPICWSVICIGVLGFGRGWTLKRSRLFARKRLTWRDH